MQSSHFKINVPYDTASKGWKERHAQVLADRIRRQPIIDNGLVARKFKSREDATRAIKDSGLNPGDWEISETWEL